MVLRSCRSLEKAGVRIGGCSGGLSRSEVGSDDGSISEGVASCTRSLTQLQRPKEKERNNDEHRYLHEIGMQSEKGSRRDARRSSIMVPSYGAEGFAWVGLEMESRGCNTPQLRGDGPRREGCTNQGNGRGAQRGT